MATDTKIKVLTWMQVGMLVGLLITMIRMLVEGYTGPWFW